MTDALLIIFMALFLLKWIAGGIANVKAHRRNEQLIRENNEARAYIQRKLRRIWKAVRTDKGQVDAEQSLRVPHDGADS